MLIKSKIKPIDVSALEFFIQCITIPPPLKTESKKSPAAIPKLSVKSPIPMAISGRAT